MNHHQDAGSLLQNETCLNNKTPNKRTTNGKSKPTSRNAARERSRVRSLRHAFQLLQDSLPAVPRHTKLSKLDVLVLASTYIAHLTQLLNLYPESNQCSSAHLHPMKKWPMRSRLYTGLYLDSCILGSESEPLCEPIQQNNTYPQYDNCFTWLNEEQNSLVGFESCFSHL